MEKADYKFLIIRIGHADLIGNCPIFWSVSFDPKVFAV